MDIRTGDIVIIGNNRLAYRVTKTNHGKDGAWFTGERDDGAVRVTRDFCKDEVLDYTRKEHFTKK